jgi:hypothetical protein
LSHRRRGPARSRRARSHSPPSRATRSACCSAAAWLPRSPSASAW